MIHAHNVVLIRTQNHLKKNMSEKTLMKLNILGVDELAHGDMTTLEQDPNSINQN